MEAGKILPGLHGYTGYSLLLSLRETIRVLPPLVEHGVVIPPLHPRAHHDKSRSVDEVDGGDVLVRDFLEPEVDLLPLLRIGLPGCLLDQPVGFWVLVPLCARVRPLAVHERKDEVIRIWVVSSPTDEEHGQLLLAVQAQIG